MGRCSWIAFEKAAKTCLTYVFSHLGLCAIVLAYSIAGSFLFQWLEQKDTLLPHNATEHLIECVDEIISISEKYGVAINGDLNEWRIEVIEAVTAHEKIVSEAVMDDRYNKTIEDLEERWSVINSLFFCVTVITTIGYGHISPRTTYGRMVTILYSIIGIPLMLLCLNNIGDSMASTFRFAYQKACCCKEQKPDPNLPIMSQTENNGEPKEKPPYQPHDHYKPKRKRMLISPPISTTIHRGSDHPAKFLQEQQKKAAKSDKVGGKVPTISKSPYRQDKYSRSSPSIDYELNTIISECASYTGTPMPEMVIREPVQPNSNNHSEVSSRHIAYTPPSSPGQSMPSSPFRKESPSVWFSNQNSVETYLSIPSFEGPSTSSGVSTRPTSPSSGWNDQSPFMFADANKKWLPPEDNDLQPKEIYIEPPKRPAGKTLVVYNTLSGDALKQQVKIQKKLAMSKKIAQLKNDSTTVFTDPVSGQPVNGDMLGLSYRPIENEPSPSELRVPISIVLSFLFSYLIMGAALFSSLESWHFLDSLYFCFITLSTIGFGDLVPGNLGFESRAAQLKLVALSLYLLMGLAVLAMSFSLVQEEVILKCKAFAEKIGLKDD